MHKTPASSDPNKASHGQSASFWWQWLLMACFVLCVFEGLARIAVYISHPTQANHHYFEHKMTMVKGLHPKKHPTWLVMGNSVMGNGIYTDLINRRFDDQHINAELLNLAIPGSNAEMALWVLKALQEKNIHPAGILMNLNPRDLTDASKGTWATLKDSHWGDCHQGAFLAEKPYITTNIECAIGQYSYLVRYRRNWKILLTDLPHILEQPDNKPSPWGETGYFSNGGWQPLLGLLPVDRVTKKEKGDVVAPQWVEKLSKQKRLPNDSTLLKFIQHCKQQNIPLILVAMPFYQQKTNADVWQTLAQQTGVQLLDIHDWVPQDPTLFVDAVHLNLLGATQLSEKLANKLPKQPWFKVSLATTSEQPKAKSP